MAIFVSRFAPGPQVFEQRKYSSCFHRPFTVSNIAFEITLKWDKSIMCARKPYLNAVVGNSKLCTIDIFPCGCTSRLPLRSSRHDWQCKKLFDAELKMNSYSRKSYVVSTIILYVASMRYLTSRFSFQYRELLSSQQTHEDNKTTSILAVLDSNPAGGTSLRNFGNSI